MVELRVFGSLDLRDDQGAEVRSVLAQPKRAALLAYLALARPRGFERRDKLLALFWPELDGPHARDALNQALRFLRRALGEETVVSRGAEEVGVDCDRLSCDALTFEARLQAGQRDEALALYRGDLLESFHADTGTEFDSWLEAERARLRARARDAAIRLCTEAEAAGELSAAAGWSRRALIIDPFDEQSLRRLVQVLDRSGDRAAALRAYEDFARRLNRELELEPAPETRAVIEAVRQRAESLLPAEATEASHHPNRESRSHRIKETVAEVHRRSLWQVLGVYLGASWVGYQVVMAIADGIGLPDWVPGFALVLFVIGLPVVLVTAFVQNGLPSLGQLNARQATTDGTRLRLTWRNALIAGAVAFLILGFSAGGYMVLRVAGVGPFGSLITKGAITDQEPLLIADVRAQSGDSTIADAIGEMLRIDFSQSSRVTIVGPGTVRAVLERMKRDPNTRLEGEIAREVARRANIKVYLEPTLARAGGKYLVTARLISAPDAKLLTAHLEEAADSSTIIDAVDRLLAKLRGRIGESFTTLRMERPLPAVTTPSLQALILFAQAQRHTEASEWDRAINLLQEAVHIDSMFAGAWRKLAACYFNAGRGRALTVPAATKAYDYRDRLTDAERIEVTAYYHGHVFNDWQKARDAYELLRVIKPGVVPFNLGVVYTRVREYDKAAAVYLQALDSDSTWALAYRNLIEVYINLNKVTDASRTLDRFTRVLPGHVDLYLGQFYIAYASGDLDSTAAALKTYGRLGGPNQQSESLSNLGMLALVQGKVEEATRTRREQFAMRLARGDTQAKFNEVLWRSRIDHELLQNPRHATARLDSTNALELLRQIPALGRPYLPLAQQYAALGDVTRARQLLADYEKAVALELRGDVRYDRAALSGLIALTDGRFTEAIARLHEAAATSRCASCWLPVLARAFDLAQQPDSAIAWLEKFVTYADVDRIHIDQFALGPAYERLAQLNERKGNIEKAALYAGKLVALWRDADPVLQPRVRAMQELRHRASLPGF